MSKKADHRQPAQPTTIPDHVVDQLESEWHRMRAAIETTPRKKPQKDEDCTPFVLPCGVIPS